MEYFSVCNKKKVYLIIVIYFNQQINNFIVEAGNISAMSRVFEVEINERVITNFPGA
jgi:hypothetical protein